MGEEAKSAENLEQTDRDLDETEMIAGEEVYIYKLTRQSASFDAVQIKMLTKQGTPLAAGVRRVHAAFFEAQAPCINPLFVRRVNIRSLNFSLDYAATHAFDLPPELEVGVNGVLTKNVPAFLPVQIIARAVKQETPESELPTRLAGDGPPCAHRWGMP